MALRILRLLPVPSTGCEDVLVGPDGRVWTGTKDGCVYAVDPVSGDATLVGRTGGRPLGLEWLPDGRLLVCDAHEGLLAMDPGTGERQVLVREVEGRRLTFVNNAAVAADGTIWFTDSTRHYDVDTWKSDLISHTRSGRLFRRDPQGAVETVIDGLAFANGVALAADESAVYVAETALRRLHRVSLGSGQPGNSAIWVDDLPGYPDNISLGSDGLIWVAIASPTDPTLSLLLRSKPWLRRAALALPEALKPAPKRTARVMAFRADGGVVHDLAASPEDWHMATGVREHGGQVWLGSLVEPAIGVLTL